jgi:hypothetical protein
MAVITNVEPNPIMVSAGDEVFRDVVLTYRTIPPAPPSGEVHIDVKDGSRVATLPAPIAETGGGTTTWEQGTVVNLVRTYEARLRATREGKEMRSFPRRLRFDKVPLAITTRDRLLRIQFALPEQGLFTENKYSVKVYLAAQGQAFPADPSFTVSAQQIENAYPNTDVWWENAETDGQWVTRKIDAVALPPGTDATIRRQAFEIGTILAGYPQIRVDVIGDATRTVLASKLGTLSADGQWSELLERITDRVRASAGDFVPLEPILPQPGSYNPSNIFGRFKALAFRVAHHFHVVSTVMAVATLRGIAKGFLDGVEGDKDTLVAIKDAFTTDPRVTARSMGEFFSKLWDAVRSAPGFLADAISKLYDRAGQASLPKVTLQDFLDAAEQGAYYYGYFIGIILEQLTVSLILKGIAGAVTIKAGAVGAWALVAIQTLKAVGWIANLTKKVLVVLRTLGYWLKVLARVGALAKDGFRFLLRTADDWVRLWDKYDNAAHVVQRISELANDAALIAQRGAAAVTQLSERVLYYLGTIDRLTDAAADRILLFFRNRSQQVAERWMDRWLGLTNGKRAIKDAFEAYDKTGEAADGVHHVLVLVADLDPPAAGTNYAKILADRYRTAPGGDRVQSALARLKRDADDVRFSDETITLTARELSHPKAPAFSDDAVEGTAMGIARECLVTP